MGTSRVSKLYKVNPFPHTTNQQQTSLETYWLNLVKLRKIKVEKVRKKEKLLVLNLSQCFQKTAAAEASNVSISGKGIIKTFYHMCIFYFCKFKIFKKRIRIKMI